MRTVQIETVRLTTSDGLSLTADVAIPDHPIGAVAIAHPHPLRGGNRFHPVIDAVMSAVSRAGFAAIRFDFRGVGTSEGAHDEGTAERLDMAAALEAVAVYVPKAPLWAIGYSFGSLVALNTDRPDLAGWVAIAPPLERSTETPVAASDPRRKLIVAASNDQFTKVKLIRDQASTWTNTSIEVVDDADHFFVGHSTAPAARLVNFLTAK